MSVPTDATAGVTAHEVVVAHYAHEALRRERERRVEETTAIMSIGGCGDADTHKARTC